MNGSNAVERNATVTTSMARMLLRAASEAGIDVERLYEDAGITRAVLDDPDGRIPYRAYVRLWAHAGQVRPGFGLFVAERFVNAASLGVLGFAAARCETFAHSIERAVQYIRLVNENTLLCFDRSSSEGVVTDVPRNPAEIWPAAHAEMALGAFVMLGRKWTGRHELPLWATFQHPKPEHHAAYRHLFGDSIRFGQPRNQVALPTSLLDAPILGADVELARYLERHAQTSIRALEQEPLVPRLRRWIAKTLPKDGTPQLADAAQAFGVGRRTLQRRLTDAGTRFDQLVDSERRRIALSALADPTTTVSEAAMRAGYGDGSAFRDAVRRWIGCAPSEFRRRAGLAS